MVSVVVQQVYQLDVRVAIKLHNEAGEIKTFYRVSVLSIPEVLGRPSFPHLQLDIVLSLSRDVALFVAACTVRTA